MAVAEQQQFGVGALMATLSRRAGVGSYLGVDFEVCGIRVLPLDSR